MRLAIRGFGLWLAWMIVGYFMVVGMYFTWVMIDTEYNVMERISGEYTATPTAESVTKHGSEFDTYILEATVCSGDPCLPVGVNEAIVRVDWRAKPSGDLTVEKRTNADGSVYFFLDRNGMQIDSLVANVTVKQRCRNEVIKAGQYQIQFNNSNYEEAEFVVAECK